MGRLAVVLGSSALGPGGANVAAAGAEHGAAIVQRHDDGAYVLPHEIDHEAKHRGRCMCRQPAKSATRSVRNLFENQRSSSSMSVAPSRAAFANAAIDVRDDGGPAR